MTQKQTPNFEILAHKTGMKEDIVRTEWTIYWKEWRAILGENAPMEKVQEHFLQYLHMREDTRKPSRHHDRIFVLWTEKRAKYTSLGLLQEVPGAGWKYTVATAWGKIPSLVRGKPYFAVISKVEKEEKIFYNVSDIKTSSEPLRLEDVLRENFPVRRVVGVSGEKEFSWGTRVFVSLLEEDGETVRDVSLPPNFGKTFRPDTYVYILSNIQGKIAGLFPVSPA